MKTKVKKTEIYGLCRAEKQGQKNSIKYLEICVYVCTPSKGG